MMSWLDEVDAVTKVVTPDALARCMPRCKEPERWSLEISKACVEFGVDDIAMLLAQLGHESSDLTRLEESLYYSAGRLMEVWPSRFPTMDVAEQYAGNEEKLANEVYGGRMGNDSPGDGWRFHGRGPIQITGRYNYQRFANAIDDQSIMDDPDKLLDPDYGARSACWYFSEHVKPGLTVRKATKAINGGYNGLSDREARFDRCLRVLSNRYYRH